MSAVNIIDKAIDVLKRYPLCDRCLGRLFGYLGKGLGNDERGKALKLVVLMEIDRRLKKNEIDVEVAKSVLLNAQRENYLKKLDMNVHGVEQKKCFICENMIDKWINEYSQKIIVLLQNLKPRSFIVGISSAKKYVEKEELLSKEFGFEYRENIKKELKREIGKKVAAVLNIQPDFNEPEVITIIDLANGIIKIDYPSLILYGYYWKYGRMISQNIWLTKNGVRKYPLSIEDVINFVSQKLNAVSYRFHIAGREDVDVRVFGGGRPIAIEFKVLNKDIDIGVVETLLNSFTPWIKFQLKMKVNRAFVARLKEGARHSKKIYRAVIHTSLPMTYEDLLKLEDVFKDKVIEQRTPTRILKRKKDKVRRRRVLKVKTTWLSPTLFEAFIECEGGLYIKELISGDNGRTKPSFSDILGCSANCLMLDVLYVHERI